MRAFARTMWNTTHWTQIYASADQSHPDGALALAQILETYRAPCVDHLVAKFRVQRTLAEDWTHSFIERRILQKELLANAKQERGRFRSFLLIALDRFAIDEIRQRQLRPTEPLAPDLVDLCETTDEAPDSIFERQWVKTLLEQALGEAEQHYQKRNRTKDWQLFREGFLEPRMTGRRDLTRKQLATKHGYPSEAKVNNTIANVVRLVRQRIKIAIVQYTSPGEEVGTEIVDLRKALSISAEAQATPSQDES